MSTLPGKDLPRDSPDHQSLIFIWGGKTCGQLTLLVQSNWTLQHSEVLSEGAEECQVLEKGVIWVTTALISLTKRKRKNKKGKVIYQTFASNKLNWNGNTLRLILFLSMFEYFHSRNLICVCRLQQQKASLLGINSGCKNKPSSLPWAHAVAPYSHAFPHGAAEGSSPHHCGFVTHLFGLSLASPFLSTQTQAPGLPRSSLPYFHFSPKPWSFVSPFADDSEVLYLLVTIFKSSLSRVPQGAAVHFLGLHCHCVPHWPVLCLTTLFRRQDGLFPSSQGCLNYYFYFLFLIF